MKINNLRDFPKDYRYSYGALEDLSSYELEDLYAFNLDEIWYWYAYGSYEGSGMLLMRKGDLYDVHNMGHCSCYGPTDRVGFSGKSLEQLKASYSAEGFKEWENLYKAASGISSIKTIDIIIHEKTNDELVVMYEEYVQFGKTGTLGNDTILRKTIQEVATNYNASFSEWMLPVQITMLDQIAKRTIQYLKNEIK